MEKWIVGTPIVFLLRSHRGWSERDDPIEEMNGYHGTTLRSWRAPLAEIKEKRDGWELTGWGGDDERIIRAYYYWNKTLKRRDAKMLVIAAWNHDIGLAISHHSRHWIFAALSVLPFSNYILPSLRRVWLIAFEHMSVPQNPQSTGSLSPRPPPLTRFFFPSLSPSYLFVQTQVGFFSRR